VPSTRGPRPAAEEDWAAAGQESPAAPERADGSGQPGLGPQVGPRPRQDEPWSGGRRKSLSRRSEPEPRSKLAEQGLAQQQRGLEDAGLAQQQLDGADAFDAYAAAGIRGGMGWFPPQQRQPWFEASMVGCVLRRVCALILVGQWKHTMGRSLWPMSRARCCSFLLCLVGCPDAGESLQPPRAAS